MALRPPGDLKVACPLLRISREGKYTCTPELFSSHLVHVSLCDHLRDLLLIDVVPERGHHRRELKGSDETVLVLKENERESRKGRRESCAIWEERGKDLTSSHIAQRVQGQFGAQSGVLVPLSLLLRERYRERGRERKANIREIRSDISGFISRRPNGQSDEHAPLGDFFRFSCAFSTHKTPPYQMKADRITAVSLRGPTSLTKFDHFRESTLRLD